MKRKILSVLAVLVAVLMSTVVLTACEKAPAGLENGGEPSVSESAEQVQGIAEVLGGYDFVGLSGVQST